MGSWKVGFMSERHKSQEEEKETVLECVAKSENLTTKGRNSAQLWRLFYLKKNHQMSSLHTGLSLEKLVYVAVVLWACHVFRTSQVQGSKKSSSFWLWVCWWPFVSSAVVFSTFLKDSSNPQPTSKTPSPRATRENLVLLHNSSLVKELRRPIAQQVPLPCKKHALLPLLC